MNDQKILIPKELWRDYNRIRNTKIYGNRIIDVIPVKEINEEIAPEIDKLNYSDEDSISLVTDIVYFLSDPEKPENYNLGSRVKSYIRRVAEDSLSYGFHKNEINIQVKPYHPPNFSERVRVNAEINLRGKKKEEVLEKIKMLNDFFLNSRDVMLCHFLEYDLFLNDKEIFNTAYISRFLSDTLKDLLRSHLDLERRMVLVKLKPPYKEAYTITDLPLLVKHFSNIAPHVFEYYKNLGITVKCLKYVDRLNPERNILDIIHFFDTENFSNLEEIEEHFVQSEFISRRKWPWFFEGKARKPILINDEKDLPEIAKELMVFEIIANCHPINFEKLSEKQLTFHPYWFHRDYDAKKVDYESIRNNVESILKKDKEIGFENPILIATGSYSYGIHILYSTFYPMMLAPPASSERLETYSQRAPGRQMLDSLRECGKIISLSEIVDEGLNLAVESDVVGIGEVEGILDHSKMCFNSGWKGPGSLNPERKGGVCVFLKEVPRSREEYEKLTSMMHVWENPSLLKMPSIEDETRRKNFRAMRKRISEVGSIQTEYYKMKKEGKTQKEIIAKLKTLI
jgi:hypothetical protein